MANVTNKRTNSNACTEADQPRTVVEAARDYFERKWKPLPIVYGKKGATYDGWPTEPTTIKDFWPGINIGVQLGKCSNGLTDIDLDCSEAIRLAQYFLPKTHAVFGRKSKQRSHYLYLTKLWKTEPKASEKYCDPTKDPSEGAVLVELRTGGQGKGAVTIVPPSKHKKSNEQVRWDSYGDPEQVDSAGLKQDVGDLAAAALLVRYYPSEGLRQEGALALGGALARANWTAKGIEEFVTAVAQAANDEEWEKRAHSAKEAVEALKEDRHVYGLPKMRELWGERVTDSAAQWLGIGKGSNGRVVLQADAPVTCAKEFLKHEFYLPDNIWTLCFYRGCFYRWTGTHYAEADPEEVRSKLYAFLDSSFTVRGQTIGPFKATKTKVNEVLDALRSCILQPRDNEVPFWIGPKKDESAEDLIACRNGLLNATTREFVPHSPYLFNVNCLPFDYDPKVPAPEQWLKFLEQLQTS